MSLRSEIEQIALEHEELERHKHHPRPVFDWCQHYFEKGRRHLLELHANPRK